MSNTTLEPNVLKWARSKAGLTEAVLAEKMGVEPEEVRGWEATGNIACEIVQSLAEETDTPFGFLFLKAPPKRVLPIGDFRTTGESALEPTEGLLEMVYAAQRRQVWYREFLISNRFKPVAFVGKSSLATPADKTADDIRTTIGIGPAITTAAKSWQDGMRATVEALEDARILFLRSGYVGSNTRKKLSVDEFRGFAIADEFAPIIFVNGADAPTAQMFTIAHEVAHIWINASGISNLERTYSNWNPVEVYCNKVAAEVLLPLAMLREAWDDGSRAIPQIENISKHFKISGVVVARRARDAGFISDESYKAYFANQVALGKKKGDGGNYYTNEQYHNSKRFAAAIIRDAREGKTLYRDAMRLLGIKKVETFRKFANSLQLDL